MVVIVCGILLGADVFLGCCVCGHRFRIACCESDVPLCLLR